MAPPNFRQNGTVPATDEQSPSMMTLITKKASGEAPPSVRLPMPGGDYAAAEPGSHTPRGGMGLRRRSERIHGDHDDAEHKYPMPRFPPAHTSAAFEAVAVRKSLILTPAEVYAECAHHGEEKAQFGWLKLLVLSVIAGCYVGFGFTICLMVGGNVGTDIYTDHPGLFSLVFGAVGFPAAFTMIVVCGAELFTSMCAYATAAWWEGRLGMLSCIRLWVITWCGNFAGCAIFIGLIYATDLYEGKDWYTLLLAQKKVHHSFGSAFVRGIFANWLVGIATWQANAAQDMAGKAIAIWLPISAFAMLGFEHVIANQFLLPMAIALGAPLSARDVIVGNFIPATLGNWVGGAVCVATTYAFAFGRPNKIVTAWFAGLRMPRGRKAAAGGGAGAQRRKLGA